MGPRLDERLHGVVPKVVKASCTQYETSSTTAKNIAECNVNIPAKPPVGLTYRVRLTGTKTSTNAAHTVTLLINSTTVMTLTADDATAVDWVAEFLIRFTGPKSQKCMGWMISNTTDGESDYAAATVDLTAGGTLKPYVTAGHGSDTVTCEMCIVEEWVL